MASQIQPELAATLVAMRRVLGVRDVLTDGKRRIWLLGGPRTLLRTLAPSRRLLLWLEFACRRQGDRHTTRAYFENAENWDGWENAIQYSLDCLGVGKGYGWQVLPVPARTLPFKAWSAAKRKWLPAGPKPHFRLCDAAPIPLGSAEGPVLIRVSDDLPPLMLSHGISREKLRGVRKCGGFLWPSFALSWRVPATYGDVVFFASSGVIAQELRPTGRHDPHYYVAGTDIWSPDARELARFEQAVEREMGADEKWWIGKRETEEGGWGRRDLQADLLTAGLSSDALVGRMSYFENWQITEPIRSRRALVRRMREIYVAYAEPSDPYAYPERDPELRISDTPYPYAELKVLGPVQLRDMPLCVYPRCLRRSVDRLLDDFGFVGVRLRIPYDGPLHAEADDAQRRDFARLVTESVLRWSQTPCHFASATVGPALRMEDSFRSGYNAVLDWRSARGRGWLPRSGYCGTQDPGPAARRLSRPMREWLSAKQAGQRVGLELAEAVAEIDDAEIADIYSSAETGRFPLSAEDARIANKLRWFPVKVDPGQVVVTLDFSKEANPTGLRATMARLMA